MPYEDTRYKEHHESGQGAVSVVAREHDIALSSFLRIAADEYIKNHEW